MLITPADGARWRAYHEIRRRVLCEGRGQVGVVRIDVAVPTATCRRVAIRSDVQRLGDGRVLLLLAQEFARDHVGDR